MLHSAVPFLLFGYLLGRSSVELLFLLLDCRLADGIEMALDNGVHFIRGHLFRSKDRMNGETIN